MTDTPEIHLPPERYQQAKRESREDVSIDATPDKLAESVLRAGKLLRDFK